MYSFNSVEQNNVGSYTNHDSEVTTIQLGHSMYPLYTN